MYWLWSPLSPLRLRDFAEISTGVFWSFFGDHSIAPSKKTSINILFEGRVEGTSSETQQGNLVESSIPHSIPL